MAESRQVVVVGGHGGMLPRYREEATAYGAEVVHYEQRIPQQERGRRSAVALVAVLVRRASHSLVAQALTLADPSRVVRLRSGSVSEMRRALADRFGPASEDPGMQVEKSSNGGARPNGAPEQRRIEFSEALRRERLGNGRGLADLAKGVSVPAARVEAWERGAEAPTKAEFGKLCLHYRRLRHFPPAAFREHRAAPVRTPEPNIDIPGDRSPAGAVPPPPLTFGEHLAAAREAEGMSQDELGSTLDVTGQAVSSWEVGRVCPVRANYEALLALLPPLRAAPEPDWRDLDVPDGGHGQPRGEAPRSDPTAEGFEAEPVDLCDPSEASDPRLIESGGFLVVDGPPPPSDRHSEPTVDPVEAVLDAYAEVRGGEWVVESVTVAIRVKGAAFPSAGATSTTGGDLQACCSSLLAGLDGEIAERIAELEKLRARIQKGAK